MTFPTFSCWKPCFSADYKQFLADHWSVIGCNFKPCLEQFYLSIGNNPLSHNVPHHGRRAGFKYRHSYCRTRRRENQRKQRMVVICSPKMMLKTQVQQVTFTRNFGWTKGLISTVAQLSQLDSHYGLVWKEGGFSPGAPVSSHRESWQGGSG